jgi:hypothetical protein
MGTVTEMNGIPVEADQLGETQACLGREQQQRVIAASEPCRSIRSGEDRLDLGAGQVSHLAFVVSLGRYREHALDMRAVGRLLERSEAKEGPDGGQAQVAGLDADVPLVLEVLQKRADEGASRSSSAKADGGLWSRAWANVNSSRNVSL